MKRIAGKGSLELLSVWSVIDLWMVDEFATANFHILEGNIAVS